MTVVPDVSFAFQPLLSTRTGETVAVEALARPKDGSIYDLLRQAGKAGRLTETDISLASGALLAAAGHSTALPVHVNILAATATRADELIRFLRPALARCGRHPHDVVLEITPPYSRVHRAALVRGVTALREQGFRIAFDAVGDGDLPLTLLTDLRPDLVKLDAHLIGGLPDDDACRAVVEFLAQYCARVDVRLAAVGVDNEEQLLCLNRAGVRLAQGNLLAGASRVGIPAQLPRPVAEIIELNATTTTEGTGVPMVADFLRPASTLPEDAPAEAARERFADDPTVNGIVLLDPDGKPVGTVTRSRFLLAVTGLYGHALNAKRPAARHGEPSRIIGIDATGLQLLEAVDDAEWDRWGEDIVVVDAAGICQGVVRLGEVVRAVAAARIEQAAALNPLTRLPGSDVIDREIDRRIRRGAMFVAAWLDVDSFKAVNDTAGFAAGDDLIRAIGRELSRAQAELPGVRVGHVGGDDFLVVAEVDEIAAVAARVVDRPWSTEGVEVCVSLASLVCGAGTISSYRDVSRQLAALKKRAKAVPGSSWVLGRTGTDRVEVLRGRTVRTADPALQRAMPSPDRVAG
ncbi:GGDEF domain-containing protein [Actinokineospora sp. UTMC 2448]|uniref:GGDEF domain-containing protein n=1 Tax=Actinokineospora sp. UTMC 2448 TaxID=2268449 RepID=UPI002164BD79|nr:GGDEF domain-containing protein [Actinokineospora sp. UTMC 2448]UVS80100.1 Blue light- and temperature-regulated antirepressor YcgF [Actinokineospora sp. UTMC 2448]